MPEKANIKSQVVDQPVLNKLIRESRGTASDSVKRSANLCITLERVIQVIKEKSYDEETKKELIKMASRCPQGGLKTFMASLITHVNSIQRGRVGPNNFVQKSPIISQRRQQKIENKDIEDKKVETFFHDVEEPIKTVEVESQINSPQAAQPQSFSQAEQSFEDVKSREEVAAALDARRAFAKRLQELESTDEIDEEWLK